MATQAVGFPGGGFLGEGFLAAGFLGQLVGTPLQPSRLVRSTVAAAAATWCWCHLHSV